MFQKKLHVFSCLFAVSLTAPQPRLEENESENVNEDKNDDENENENGNEG